MKVLSSSPLALRDPHLLRIRFDALPIEVTWTPVVFRTKYQPQHQIASKYLFPRSHPSNLYFQPSDLWTPSIYIGGDRVKASIVNLYLGATSQP